jgi:hypothetical protein
MNVRAFTSVKLPAGGVTYPQRYVGQSMYKNILARLLKARTVKPTKAAVAAERLRKRDRC